MKKLTFEEFLLEEVHSILFPQILDDDITDHFNGWLGILDGEQYLKYGEFYGKYQYLLGKESVLIPNNYMNPEEHREFRDDVDEESWVDPKSPAIRVFGETQAEAELREDDMWEIDADGDRQLKVRIELPHVFENEAVEDIEKEAVEMAHQEDLNNH